MATSKKKTIKKPQAVKVVNETIQATTPAKKTIKKTIQPRDYRERRYG